MLGRFAPGTCRADGPGQLTADVSQENMLRLLPLLLLAGPLVAAPKSAEFYTSSVSRYVGSEFSKGLAALVTKIEGGNSDAWMRFKEELESPNLDGERSQTFSVACAEISRRDPTFFLRMYLLGDKVALKCAQRAYGYTDAEGRAIMDQILSRRLYIAEAESEKAAIKRFIRESTKKENG